MATLPRMVAGALLVALAIAVAAPFLLWVFGSGRGLCPADVPAVLAGLTWASTDYPSYNDADICITTETSAVRRLHHWQGRAIPMLAWSPDGEALAIWQSDDSPVFVSISGEVLNRGEPVPKWYAEREADVMCGDVCTWQSPDGRSVALYSVNGGLWVGPSGARTDLRYIMDGGMSPKWSPDSGWVAFEVPPTGISSDPISVWVVRSDGGSLTRIAANAGSPVWRPGGD